jgi:hypothetical protein
MFNRKKVNDNMNNDTRFPYTYASDYIRSIVGHRNGNAILSRSEASQIRTGIAKVIGMDDHELAIQLATHYQLHEKEITAKTAKDFIDFMIQS